MNVFLLFPNFTFCQGSRGDLGGPGTNGEGGKRVKCIFVFHLEVKKRHSAIHLEFSPIFTEYIRVVIKKA